MPGWDRTACTLKEHYEQRARMFYGSATPVLFSRPVLAAVWLVLAWRYLAGVYSLGLAAAAGVAVVGYVLGQTQHFTGHMTLHGIFNNCHAESTVPLMWPVPYLGWLHHYGSQAYCSRWLHCVTGHLPEEEVLIQVKLRRGDRWCSSRAVLLATWQ